MDRDYSYVPYSRKAAPSYDNKAVPPPALLSTPQYQVPSSKRGVAYPVSVTGCQVPVRPYAVVGVGSQPNLSTVNNTTAGIYDTPRTKAQRNKYHNMNLRTTRSMSPVQEPDAAKVAPTTIPSTVMQQQAFSQGEAAGNSSLHDNYTDVMAKALEQFDSLLQPPHENKQIIQTSL